MTLIRTVGVLSAVVLAGSLTLGAGCSSSTSGGGGGGGTGDSGAGTKDTGSSTTDTGYSAKDTGTTPGDSTTPDDTTGSQDQGDAATCAPGSTSSFTPATYVAAVAHQGLCSATQISAFITACGYDNGSQTACTTWQTANVPTDAGAGGNSCGSCIIAPKNNGGTWQDPLGMNNAYAALPNYAGCIQLSDPTNGTACATALNNIDGCLGVACDASCAAAMADPTDCQNAAASGSCMSYNSAEMTACASDLAADGGGAGGSCFPSNASGDGDADFTYILTLICGGATDGGAPGDASDQ